MVSSFWQFGFLATSNMLEAIEDCRTKIALWKFLLKPVRKGSIMNCRVNNEASPNPLCNFQSSCKVSATLSRSVIYF